jgi:hypothetical protein
VAEGIGLGEGVGLGVGVGVGVCVLVELRDPKPVVPKESASNPAATHNSIVPIKFLRPFFIVTFPPGESFMILT